MKKARRDGGFATLHAMNEAREAGGWKKASVQAVYHFKRHRDRDHDGLIDWLKAYLDGMADARLIVNDCGLTHLPPEIVEGSTDPRVELHVTRTDTA